LSVCASLASSRPQKVLLPPHRPLGVVYSVAQLLKLPASLGFYDGLEGFFERFPGLLGAGLGLPGQDFLNHLRDGLLFSHALSTPF
jgi:hypothetical protein